MARLQLALALAATLLVAGAAAAQQPLGEQLAGALEAMMPTTTYKGRVLRCPPRVKFDMVRARLLASRASQRRKALACVADNMPLACAQPASCKSKDKDALCGECIKCAPGARRAAAARAWPHPSLAPAPCPKLHRGATMSVARAHHTRVMHARRIMHTRRIMHMRATHAHHALVLFPSFLARAASFMSTNVLPLLPTDLPCDAPTQFYVGCIVPYIPAFMSSGGNSAGLGECNKTARQWGQASACAPQNARCAC
jgi:hypothetical protein